MSDAATAGMYLLIRQMQQLYPSNDQIHASPIWLQKITDLAVLLERHRICLHFDVLSSTVPCAAAGPPPVDHVVLRAAYALDDMRALSPFFLVMIHRDYRLACCSFALLKHAAPFVDAVTCESSSSQSLLFSCTSSWDSVLPSLIRSSACVFAFSSEAHVRSITPTHPPIKPFFSPPPGLWFSRIYSSPSFFPEYARDVLRRLHLLPPAIFLYLQPHTAFPGACNFNHAPYCQQSSISTVKLAVSSPLPPQPLHYLSIFPQGCTITPPPLVDTAALPPLRSFVCHHGGALMRALMLLMIA
jgi:hypothetical protein